MVDELNIYQITGIVAWYFCIDVKSHGRLLSSFWLFVHKRVFSRCSNFSSKPDFINISTKKLNYHSHGASMILVLVKITSVTVDKWFLSNVSSKPLSK